MAAKLDLLLDFTNGQGVSGGASNYVNYPVDFDSNFTAIQTTVNTMIDELNAARLNDAAIPTDILFSDAAVANGPAGRFSPWECKVTFTTSTITVTSGRIYAAGRRIDVTGTTFPFTGNGVFYIATDQSGSLAISTTALQSTFDIAAITASGGVWASGVDNLGFNQLTPLNTGNVVNRIFERVTANGGSTGKQNPAIRTVDVTGDEGDAGFEYLEQDGFSWQSQRASGHGSGAAVDAAHFRTQGQLQLLEQARVIATGTAVAAGISNAFTALNLDTADRREPASYLANPFFTPTSSTLTVPSGGQYDGTYLVTGYVQFPNASTTGPYNADIFADSTVVARGGISKPGASVDGTINLSGMIDLAAGDTIEIRAGTGSGSAENVNCRLALMLIGGP